MIPARFGHHWGPALVGLAITGLAACGTLPCNEACTPAMWAAQDKLEVAPLRYAEIFGTEWVAGVSVDGKTATTHYPPVLEAAK